MPWPCVLPPAGPRPSRGNAPGSALQPMLVHAAVERGAGEAELGGGERAVVGVLLQGGLDHVTLGAFAIEVAAAGRGRRRRRSGCAGPRLRERSEQHTSELQSLMRI